MFLLTFNNYDEHDVKGVFTTAETAKHYVATVLGAPDLNWSDPTHRIDGGMWANYAGGNLSLNPVPVDPAE